MATCKFSPFFLTTTPIKCPPNILCVNKSFTSYIFLIEFLSATEYTCNINVKHFNGLVTAKLFEYGLHSRQSASPESIFFNSVIQ